MQTSYQVPDPSRKRRWHLQDQPNHSHPHRWAVKPATSTRMLWCGLLAAAAGAACASGDSLVPQASPAVVSPSAVCDVVPLGEPTVANYTARFVAYGDVDSDDDVPCGMISDVRIAVIEKMNRGSIRDNRSNWWKAVGGGELGIERLIPPGVRVPTTAEKLSAAPAQFVTTGADGTANMPVADRSYSVCIILPSDDLITGCHNDLRIRESTFHSTVYIYFTHGHAIIEMGSSDRYQRFLNDATSSATPANVMFEASSGSDTVDLPDNILELSDYSEILQDSSAPIVDLDVIVVDSAYVNSWWATVSDNGVNGLDVNRLKVGSEVFAHDWVHVVTTGPDGLAKTALSPGDYLVCTARARSDGRLSCVYENLASGHHKFYITQWPRDHRFSITRQQ